MPAVHVLISEPSGHDGKSLPELMETETLVKVTYGGCFAKNILHVQTLRRKTREDFKEVLMF